MTAHELAQTAAKAAVDEMVRRNLVRSNKMGSFKKTERILYEYPVLREIDTDETQRFCRLIEKALDRVADDPYYDIIALKYWKRKTHEQIAEYFDVDVSVISKRRTKLIDRLRPMIFSDDFINEMYEL